jgi:tetratricopeptide (TPR) repeat protein
LAATVGPCAYLEAPREVSRWYLAAAQVEREAGHKELADQQMSHAQRWSPDDPAIFLARAEWRREDGQYLAALEDVNSVNERIPDNPAVLIERSQILQHLGRHDEAIADWRSLDRMSVTSGIPSRPMALNGLAYARAVGNVQLDEALKGIEEALVMQPGDPMFLDTHGFILYRQGKYSESITDMERAVIDIEKLLREPTKDRPLLIQGVAAVRYHRALVLEKLGRYAEAKLDRARAKQLIGREPDETLF